MSIDGTDAPLYRKEIGLLDTLSAKQEAIKGLLADIKADEDKTFMGGLITEFPDTDALVAIVLILNQLSHDPNREPRVNDLVWGMEFLDHLDTLGLQVCPKGSIVRG